VGKIIAINLTGPMRLMKAVAPVTKAQGQGRIVNIASVAGVGPTGSSIAYAVSKAGLIHLTRCMAVALAPRWRGPKPLARQARHFRECLSPASTEITVDIWCSSSAVSRTSLSATFPVSTQTMPRQAGSPRSTMAVAFSARDSTPRSRRRRLFR
jgi:NAD(P)-dependent dehydrogenase (short-subunit alcohol dehydrogenase family)